MEATECGAACLAMVLGFHGRHVPLAQLRRECGVSRDGSKASYLVKAAERHGCVARGQMKTVDRLRQTALPAIAFWQFNHYVVVERFEPGCVFLNDPAVGHRRMPIDEFAAGFTGVTLTVEPGPDFQRAGQPLSAWPALRAALRGHGSDLAFAALAGLILVVPGILLPVMTSIFIDSVLVDQRVDWYRPILAATAAVLLLKLIVMALEQAVTRRFVLALQAKLETRFIRHLLRLPVSFYGQRFPGEIVGRAQLNEQIATTVAGPLTNLGIDLFTMLLYGVVLVCFSPLLTGIAVALALVNFALLGWIARSREEAALAAQQQMGRVSAALVSGLQGIETIKAGGQENAFFAKWAGYYVRALNAGQALQRTSLYLGVLPTVTQGVTGVLILLVGGHEVMAGAMTLGMLVAFTTMMTSFQAPVARLLAFSSQLQLLRASLVRIHDVLDNPIAPQPAAALPVDATGRIIARCTGRLEIRHVTFGFTEAAKPLIEDFSLTVEPGRSVAFVGGSGSGKSTLARLICGLYDPWQGEILFDGHPPATLPRPLRRNSLGFVEQELTLFEGSVRENLTLWDPAVSTAEIMAACATAEIHETIQNLPGGYDAPLLENGANLSGGQRQRLELARAFVHQPTLLVLDEATSALDAETERQIILNLRLRGCTCIVVAHRLSTVRDCDEIVVLDAGRVVERGTHDELVARRGAYWRLVQPDRVENAA